MFGLMFRSPTVADLLAEKQRKLERLSKAEPWSETMAWRRELNLKADTYVVRRFFDGQRTESLNGRWLYEEKILAKGSSLATHQGSRTGSVVFDGTVIIPALFQKDDYSFTGWGQHPFMSLTPMELLTLRAGTKLATGHVVIAGLGMGHQLIEVARKKTVKKITVVEKCQELVDFIWPEIWKHLPAGKSVELVVGDAYEELPKLTANVALVDIFEHYGSNRFEVRDLSPGSYKHNNFGWKPVSCPGIKRVWVWGAADVKGDW